MARRRPQGPLRGSRVEGQELDGYGLLPDSDHLSAKGRYAPKRCPGMSKALKAANESPRFVVRNGGWQDRPPGGTRLPRHRDGIRPPPV